LPPHDTIEQLDGRIARLAEYDSDSAEILKRQARPATTEAPPARTNAEAAARAWIAENIVEKDHNAVILAGSGSGLDMVAFMAALPRSCVAFWVEHDPAIALATFTRIPVEEYVASGRMRIAIADNSDKIKDRFLDIWNLSRAPQFCWCELGIDTDEERRFYHEAILSICRAVQMQIFNLGTMICRGSLWQFNTLRNLTHIMRNPGVQALDGAFHGLPALIVGAGPSLNRMLPWLSKCAGGYTVISTGTALRALNKAGIRPDLVVAVDAHPLTASQFTVPCNDLILACSTLVYPPAANRFGRLFCGTLNANPIDAWLDGIMGARGSLLAAGTVTSTAIDLAIRMGCNPVVCIGFDLSLADDGTTHAQNTMYHGVKMDKNYVEFTQIPGNYSEWVTTTHQFRNYVALIEQYIETKPGVTFINVNDAGAKIRGMALAPPERLADFAAEPFGAAAKLSAIHSSFITPATAAIAAELEENAARLDEIAAMARRSATLCNRLMTVMLSPTYEALSEMKSLIGELDRADEQMAALKEASFLLEMSLWPAQYAANMARADHEKRLTDAAFINKRRRMLYEQTCGAAMWTRDLLNTVVGELRSAANVRADGNKQMDHNNTACMAAGR